MHTLHMVTAEPGEAHDARSQANPRPPKWFLCERALDPDTRNFSLAHLSPRGKKHAHTPVADYRLGHAM